MDLMEEILRVELRIAESNSAVLPLHHISMWCRWEDSNPRSYKRQIYSLLSLSILTTTTWLLGQDYDSQMLRELPKNKWRMVQDLNLWSFS